MSLPRRPGRVLASLSAVATLTVGLLGGTSGSAPASTATPHAIRAATSATPLTVRLDRLDPASIPRKGRILLTGVVSNTSSEDWTGINVYPFISERPITSRDQLAKAASTPADTEVGDRLTGPGRFAKLGDLAEGQRARFRISVPRRVLPITGAPGVYWIGVHALGQSPQGRDLIADGRARTFIPLILNRRATSAVAIVLPLRQQVRPTPMGSVADQGALIDQLGSAGRLGRLRDFAASAGSHSVNWLVDPAVLDAVNRVSTGNPPVTLGPETTSGTTTSATPSPAPTPDPSPAETVSPADQSLAKDWLRGFRQTASRAPVLGLGYADPDATALARLHPVLLQRALDRAQTTFAAMGLPQVPTLAPVDGAMDDATLSSTKGAALALISDQEESDDNASGAGQTLWKHRTGPELAFADQRVIAGGPAPTAALNPLELRQRILSDAALRASTRPQSPMVVELPANWNPGPYWRSSDFFIGLDQPWLSLTSLPSRTASPTYTGSLELSSDQRQRQLPGANIVATRNLIGIAATLGQLLDTKNDVSSALVGDALTAVSYAARGDEVTARVAVNDLAAVMRQHTSGIRVTGTDFVTLPGGSGTLSIALVNDLDQPVVVGLRARTGTRGVRIDAHEPIQIGPHQRMAVRLAVHASATGVHQVAINAVTDAGREVGTPFLFTLRTSQTSRLIWALLIGGAALLLSMIARRIIRRIRNHRWRDD